MTVERILVGVDFSTPSRNAAQWTARQFGADTEIVLMHAIHLSEPPRAIGGSLDHRIQHIETARRGAEVRMAELRSTLSTERVGTRIRVGRPVDELPRAARETSADLIVVGETSTRRGLSRVLDGMVEALLRRSPASLLLHRGSPQDAPRRILVAVDESARAPHVLSEALRFGARFKADVTVLHVVGPALTGAVGIAAAERERRVAIQQIESSAAIQVEAVVATLRSAGVWAEALVVSGEPASKILDVARELGADLIIIGLRRPSRFERALLGWIAQDVLRDADCSVLVALPRA